MADVSALFFSLILMNRLPAALTPALFNEGIPDVLANGENIWADIGIWKEAMVSEGGNGVRATHMTDHQKNAKLCNV